MTDPIADFLTRIRNASSARLPEVLAPYSKIKAELARIAARSNEPLLAFSTDEANIEGIDPLVNTRDLGSDPLAYAERRVKLVRELWARAQSKPLKDGESRNILRRNLTRGFGTLSGAAGMAVKFIGGVEINRDHAGSPRANFTPVSAEKQRAALKLLTTELLSSRSFQFKPEFLANLAIDPLRNDDFSSTEYKPRPWLCMARHAVTCWVNTSAVIGSQPKATYWSAELGDDRVTRFSFSSAPGVKVHTAEAQLPAY